MIDVHCHLNFHSFEKDYDQVIKSAFEAGVTKIINVGTKIDSSEQAVELAQKYENLYAIVGVHPHHADKPEANWLEELEKLAKKPKVVAIGEIGMDYFSYKSNDIADPKLQKEVFIKQIELAHKLKLPLQIHNRQAGKDILDILLRNKSYLLNPPGMFHCMSGNLDFLKQVLDLGFYVGFDGNITYNGFAPGEDTDLKDLVKYAPIDRIVVETDSPFLTPIPKRGSRNMPEYAIITARAIAKLKGVTFQEIEAKTTENAIELFDL
ncbi:MAG: TatD family hydrolase [Candidatus Levybacteria bacterium]|nr:TatD family hydrolase [Candidatus Levybacteria bacterium]